MKRNALAQLSILLSLISIYHGCSDSKDFYGHGNIQGEEMPNPFIIDIGDETDWDYWMYSSTSDEEIFLQELNSIPFKAVYTAYEEYSTFYIYFNERGLVSKIVVSGKPSLDLYADFIYTVYNYSGSKLDMDVILPDGSIESVNNIETNINWDSITYSKKKYENSINDRIRIFGNVLGAIPCAASIAAASFSFEAGPPLLDWQCDNDMASGLADLAEFYNIIEFWNVGERYDLDIASGICGGYHAFEECLVENAQYRMEKMDDIDLAEDIVFNSTYSYGKVSDIDGNTYKTIQIGDQTWMAENLKTTHYSDSTAIPYIENISSWDILDVESKAYSWYDDNPKHRDIYGALYTWASATNGIMSTDANPSGVQGVCPAGWHLPSDTEWKELEMYVGLTQSEADGINNRGTVEAMKMKEAGDYHWAGDTYSSNSTGFTALPGGMRNSDGSSNGLHKLGSFWTSTDSETEAPGSAWSRFLFYENGGIYRYSIAKDRGLSVRCIKD